MLFSINIIVPIIFIWKVSFKDLKKLVHILELVYPGGKNCIQIFWLLDPYFWHSPITPLNFCVKLDFYK